METVKFFTVGCKVNQYDTQAIRERFLNSGFKELENHLPADTYVINTCTVTLRADADSLNLIRRAKRENPQAKLIVTGCLAQLDADKIKEISRRISILKDKDKNSITYFKGHTRAFLKIQDGCNNFCSYCRVPLARGRSRSRPLDEIAKEAAQLVKNGFKEIVLAGICLGSYGKDLKPRLNLIDAIEALEKIKGLLRIRLSSIEARDVSDGLIQKIAKSQKLCRHLHIPLQSGDDEILKKMNRNYSGQDFLGLIQKIKKQVPKIAITTDALVGFPGETENNFHNTLNAIKKILPLKVHIFPYSKREGTAVFQYYQDEINPMIIKKRVFRLANIGEECSLNYKRQFLGKAMTVLIEGRCKENLDFWQGYTDNYMQIKVKSGKDLKNKFISLRLKQIDKNFILADFITKTGGLKCPKEF